MSGSNGMISGGGELVGPVDIEVLASSLPDKVATGAGDINVAVLPNYLRAVLDCINKRKAMRVSADLQRRKTEVMGRYIDQSARVSMARIQADHELGLAQAGYDFAAQMKSIEAYRDAQMETIRSNERIQMKAIDAQFDLQLEEVRERYESERLRIDREWDAFEMLLDEGKRRYRDAAKRMQLKEKERKRLVKELEGSCAYFMDRVKAGDPTAMGAYLALVSVRANLLQGEGSLDDRMDAMIGGWML